LTCPASYAITGIALWIIAPFKPPYPAKDTFVKVKILQGGSLYCKGTKMD